MSFFKRQDLARRRTGLLVLYLLLAVALIVAAVNAVVYGVVVWSGWYQGEEMDVQAWLAQPWWQYVSLAVVAIILIGSIVRYFALRDGGRAIAEMMGARRVDPGTNDADERRLVNVVEEMSIASGTPVPTLYVMDEEEAINAFVAGFRPTEAVMVVTRGTIAQLDRDELQGVVAHEYSHILNGDMRLNVRLMAILAGILSLGVVGRIMMRALLGGSRRRRHGTGVRVGGSRNSRGSQAQLAIFLLGLALFVIGYIGLFFGRMIKAAVSRQREFLADASSVQFTRNPDGIAGALWKIGRNADGSLLASAHAEDTSHMCFGESVQLRFAGLMATHPPIEERIRAVDPHFKGKVAAQTIRQRQAERSEPRTEARERTASPADALVATSAAVIAASVGNPGREHVDRARWLHEGMPEDVLAAAHASQTARHVVYALLLGDVAEERERVARALLVHQEDEETANAVVRLRERIDGLGEERRLPLLEVALPALRELSKPQRRHFLGVVEKLVRVDRRVSPFEFALQTLLASHLHERAGRADAVRHRSFDPVLPQIRVLLSLLARAGARGEEQQAQAAFARAMASFSGVKLTLADEEYCRPESMPEVLERLAGLAPVLKQPLIGACADCVLHDGKVTVSEAELLRAVSAALDCPMPPLVPGDA